MAKDFSKATRTRAGYAVIDIKWNGAANGYLGKVADPNWKREGRDFVTAQWSKAGRCKNAGRSDCDLIL